MDNTFGLFIWINLLGTNSVALELNIKKYD